MSESLSSDLHLKKREPFAELMYEDGDPHDAILQVLTKRKQQYLENPLENHSIQPSLRARMAEWMIEIISSFNLKHRTYFLAVSLMDLFLKKTEKEFESRSIHIIGVACMMIASKFNDTRYITVETANRYMLCGEIRENELTQMEVEIIQTIQGAVGIVISYDIVCVLCEKYKVSNNVKRTAITILYLIQMYYDALKFTANEQAYGAFLISLYTLGQKSIIESIQEEGECFVELKVVDAMHSGVLKFTSCFPGFTNPMRFLGFEFSNEESGEMFVFDRCTRFE